MPLSRLLLPLCGLLLALAVTSVSAAAPAYGADEVTITVASTPTSTARDAQVSYCSSAGGALVPMVTNAVYNAAWSALNDAGFATTFSYMGGSTMLSSECTTEAASLECIWYWDQGRYTGADNAVSFFRGNRGNTTALPGAGLMSTVVRNYWGLDSSGSRCPCDKMQRYSAVLRDNNGAPYWSDTDSSAYSYESLPYGQYFAICAIEQSTPTTAKPSDGSSSVNVPLVVGLSVGVGVALIVVIAVIVSLVCCGGCSCLAGSPGVAAAQSTATLSRRGSMVRGDSHRIGMDDLGNRSFRDGALGKNGSIRYTSVRGCDDDVEPWRSPDDMMSRASSQYRRMYSNANMAAGPLPGAGNMTMGMPPQMMQQQMMPPQMMPEQRMPEQMMQQQMMSQQRMPEQRMPEQMMQQQTPPQQMMQQQTPPQQMTQPQMPPEQMPPDQMMQPQMTSKGWQP